MSDESCLTEWGPPNNTMARSKSKIYFGLASFLALTVGPVTGQAEKLGDFEVQVGQTIEISRSHS